MFQKKRNTFHGGVHPYEGKELSKDKPIVKAQPGNLLYYAVSQHIGAPAVPTVQKGDHVKAGQKIAEAGGFVSAPVYASVSGMVKELRKSLPRPVLRWTASLWRTMGCMKKKHLRSALIGKNSTQIRSGRRSKKPESSEWEVRVSRHTSRYHRKIRQRLTTFLSTVPSANHI